MVLSGLVSWCQRADSCNGWSVRDKGGEGRNYDHNRKFFFTTKKGKTMEEKVRKIRKKRVFTVEKGRQQFRFCRTNVISEKNTEKGETYPIYLGSD